MSVTDAPHIIDLARALQERAAVHGEAEAIRGQAVKTLRNLDHEKDNAESTRDDAAAALQTSIGRFELGQCAEKEVKSARKAFETAEQALSDLIGRHAAVASQAVILETAAEKAKAARVESKRALAAALAKESRARVIEAWERFCDLTADHQRLHWVSGERPTPVVANGGPWDYQGRPGTLRAIADRCGLNPDNHFVVRAEHCTESEATLLARVDLG